MKVCILGASGFIGKRLTAALRLRDYEVLIASMRHPQAAAAIAATCDTVVNLAGESVAQKWTPAVKAAMRTSRVDAPRAFLQALGTYEHRPKRYISASAIGFYGTSKTATFDEGSAAGSDFLAGLCVAWEAEAQRAQELGMHLSIIRTGLVLGADGGVLQKILPIFKVGGGGPIGDGQQWYSWIHIDDVIGIYLAAIDGTNGILNATAPMPVTNKDFTQALGHAVQRPAVVPVPAFALKMLLGEGAVVALEGQRVLPTRTLAQRYTFTYRDINDAFHAIV